MHVQRLKVYHFQCYKHCSCSDSNNLPEAQNQVKLLRIYHYRPSFIIRYYLLEVKAYFQCHKTSDSE